MKPSSRMGGPTLQSRKRSFGSSPERVNACIRLRRQGFLLVVVTNQPDIARGTIDRAVVEKINMRLQRELTEYSIWVCPHDDEDACSCRKPAPGLLHQAAAHHDIDVQQSYLVGDRWRDIEAGRAVGCRTLLVVNPSYQERLAEGADVEVRDLLDATAWIEAEDAFGEKETRHE